MPADEIPDTRPEVVATELVEAEVVETGLVARNTVARPLAKRMTTRRRLMSRNGDRRWLARMRQLCRVVVGLGVVFVAAIRAE